ncbi:MAG: malto-oligosyltrehalose trehalohydrolase [Rhodospirillales bacterium]|nr:malto-oligosyltrehalose trehalohydrolase [Rhodospirillales bacterium]
MSPFSSLVEPQTGVAPIERTPLASNTPSAAASGTAHHRLPIGAEVLGDGCAFRVWAPSASFVEVVIAETIETLTAYALTAEANGYHSGIVPSARAGTLYWFRLDGDDELLADPASRFQPEGPLGPSQIVDPHTFNWTDGAWTGPDRNGIVVYELHIGTFTREGTWQAAIEHIASLAELGITMIEVMPVADFAGTFGWGYDGVNLFAPTHLYGGPDDFRAFVDAAHRHNVSVVLDVVYNHFGPVGNFVSRFSADYFSNKHDTDWGTAINFDGEHSGPVREFYVANAEHWIAEYHLDGLRLDATQNIYDFDEQHEHILAAVTRQARKVAPGRAIFVVGENEPQNVRLLRPPSEGGYGLDALWNDDLHHSAMVALTGRSEAYYTDYRGSPQEFVSAAKHGFLYQGQRYAWQKQPRGTPTFGIAHRCFVTFIQNHDQIANSGLGQRIQQLANPGRLRAFTSFILLAPGTPMLFMGQEFAASAPFLYFADHDPGLADAVHNGRKEFLQQFPSLATPEMQQALPHPDDRQTFERSKLDHSERDSHGEVYALHRDLLKLRRDHGAFGSGSPQPCDGAVLGAAAFVLRFFTADGDDRLLLVNLGADLHLDPAPEPLLAPPVGCTWSLAWSSEDPRYGGLGTPAIYSEDNWKMPGNCAVVMQPTPISSDLQSTATDLQSIANDSQSAETIQAASKG